MSKSRDFFDLSETEQRNILNNIQGKYKSQRDMDQESIINGSEILINILGFDRFDYYRRVDLQGCSATAILLGEGYLREDSRVVYIETWIEKYANKHSVYAFRNNLVNLENSRWEYGIAFPELVFTRPGMESLRHGVINQNMSFDQLLAWSKKIKKEVRQKLQTIGYASSFTGFSNQEALSLRKVFKETTSSDEDLDKLREMMSDAIYRYETDIYAMKHSNYGRFATFFHVPQLELNMKNEKKLALEKIMQEKTLEGMYLRASEYSENFTVMYSVFSSVSKDIINNIIDKYEMQQDRKKWDNERREKLGLKEGEKLPHPMEKEFKLLAMSPIGRRAHQFHEEKKSLEEMQAEYNKKLNANGAKLTSMEAYVNYLEKNRHKK